MRAKIIKDLVLAFNTSQINKRNIKFPGKIDLAYYNGNVKQIIMKIPSEYVITNMQNDNAAFEGWCLVLKRWLDIDKIIFEWDFSNGLTGTSMQHYQRFLYRVKNFQESNNWFIVENNCIPYMNDLRIKLGGKYLLNFPSKNRIRSQDGILKKLSEFRETDLETAIVSIEVYKNNLMKISESEYLDNQLPVGVFDTTVSNKTKIFTGSKSAIDIWGINEKDNRFNLFELKDISNSKVGAISELYLYSFIIRDLQKGVFSYPHALNPVLNKASKTNGVNTYLFAPNFHPLIDNKLIDIMNLGTQTKHNIHFGLIKIDSSFSFTKVL